MVYSPIPENIENTPSSFRTDETDDYVRQALKNMIECQIRPWQVLDHTVLTAFESLPRHHFVPTEYAACAYMDYPLPLPHGQAMLEPKIEARLLQTAELTGTERIAHIGTGSGYLAALLAHLGKTVLSWEIEGTLVDNANNNLKKANITGVEVRHADGFTAIDGQYDRIILSGAVTTIPELLKNHLQPNGMLIAIVGQAPAMTAYQCTIDDENHWHRTPIFDTCVPLLNHDQNQGFVF